jgi:hypothetical protein
MACSAFVTLAMARLIIGNHDLGREMPEIVKLRSIHFFVQQNLLAVRRFARIAGGGRSCEQGRRLYDRAQ